jgi:8-oxo-dGTP pyrophosphatase MutT (NUDIX family)
MPVSPFAALGQNEVMRRIGEPWLPGKPYKDRMGAYGIIVSRDGQLLLVDERGELQLPGGGIDPGESRPRRFIAK